jgi:DNA-directed RNA polymerase subunit RPC12/RpoP
MPALVCPSCGADVPLRDAAMPYAVCAYCQSLIMRAGESARAVGKSAVIPFDVSPIRIGTSIEDGGVSCDVIGRVRWGWSQGSWNEWLLRGADGGTRWLGEATGMFMPLVEHPAALDDPVARAFAEGGPIAPHATVTVEGKPFTASDVKQARCLGGEGELPFPAAPDWTMTSVDFRAADGSALCLQRDGQGTTAWIGRYCELSELRPRGLRVVEGWTIPAGLA